MENSVIKNLVPTGFFSEFEYEDATGTLTTDGQKALQSFIGGKEGVGSFDARKLGDGTWQYNPHYTDPEMAEELNALMVGARAAIEAELAPAED